MPMKPVDMIKLLKQNGFITISQNGSHVKLRNSETGRQVIVPLHSKEMKKGTEQDILKRAGLK
ncbi:MAG: type II toxin-antitoxin system HicA family toxin [Lachnospiraceae bacterium]|nr:type II toxin-antitoxin system HicA family toxin [Lachnospiraceae bacterium]